MQTVAQQRTDAAGALDLVALPPGTCALGAELTGFTPDFATGLVLAPEAQGALTKEIVLDDADASVLHPVTAVLVPNLPRHGSTWYTRERSVPLLVLAFGGMTKMRLSTGASFSAEGGGEEPFVPYAAAAAVPLPG